MPNAGNRGHANESSDLDQVNARHFNEYLVRQKTPKDELGNQTIQNTAAINTQINSVPKTGSSLTGSAQHSPLGPRGGVSVKDQDSAVKSSDVSPSPIFMEHMVPMNYNNDDGMFASIPQEDSLLGDRTDFFNSIQPSILLSE